ncbi:hypothetical protein ACHAWF_011636 [Thalassiosira exigua]
MTPADYSKFGGFFDAVIRDYHGDVSGDKKHITDWNVDGADYDVKKLGQDELSMRVRVGRNLLGFNLPGEMDKEERIKFEQKMLPAFDQLKEKYGGHVYSLTPDFGELGSNPNLITQEKYQELVDAHVMFKDMDADPVSILAGLRPTYPTVGCSHNLDNFSTSKALGSPLIGLMDVGAGSRTIRCASFGLARRISSASCA